MRVQPYYLAVCLSASVLNTFKSVSMMCIAVIYSKGQAVLKGNSHKI
jgi:hypothetical protein